MKWARVNLIVGKEDSGKTFFLKVHHLKNWYKDEALRIMASFYANMGEEKLKDFLIRFYEPILDRDTILDNLLILSLGKIVEEKDDLIYIMPTQLYLYIEEFVDFKYKDGMDVISMLLERKTALDPYFVLSVMDDCVKLSIYCLNVVRLFQSVDRFKVIEELEPFRLLPEMGFVFSSHDGRIMYNGKGGWVDLSKAPLSAFIVFLLFSFVTLSTLKGRMPEVILDHLYVANPQRFVSLISTLAKYTKSIILSVSDPKVVESFANIDLPLKVFAANKEGLKEVTIEDALRMLK